jgi:N-acetylglucosamine-6-sulfatase
MKPTLYSRTRRIRNWGEAMENKLYSEMPRLGGMEIPLSQPAGGINNKRLRSRGGAHAADFPEPTVVDQPINQNAN